MTRSFCIMVAVLVVLFANSSFAFGTKRAHETLLLESIDRLASDREVLDYLRGSLALELAFKEQLALQFGLDTRIDADLITDATDEEKILTRLNQSRSLWDEDDNGPAEFPPIPSDYSAFFRRTCRGRPDFDTCYRSELTRVDVARLLAIGSYAEDNPNPRARHHFHDSERSHGPSNFGLDDSDRLFPSRIDDVIADFVTAWGRGGSWLRAVASLFQLSELANFELRGRSALARALNSTQGGGLASDVYPQNLFALPDAERYLYRAITYDEEDERENYMALHFIALGHVVHLLQDMGSVAHVRNDFIVDHVVVDRLPDYLGVRSLEDAGDDFVVFPSVLAAIDGGLFNEPVQAMIGSGSSTVPTGFYEIVQASLDPEGFDVEDFWDRQPLGEPDDSQPERAGLAERVHNRFVSAGSVSNSASQGGYDRPLVPLWTLGSQVGSGPDAVRSVELPERDLQTGAVTANTSRYLSSPTVPHLARCNYHCIYGLPDARLNYSVIDESVQRDYLELLFPLVLDYTSKFLQHYLAQRIEVVPTGPSQFTLRNLTDLPFIADSDAIEIAYTAADPTRPEGRRQRAEVSCSTSEIELPGKPVSGGSAPLGDFVCTMPATLPDPPLRADYWVVVRGQLGARGEAGTPSEFDTGIGPKDFVVAFDRVQPEILFQSQPGSQPGVNDDAMNRVDLKAIPADLSRSIANPDESPVIRDLGNDLRPALASRFGLDPEEVALLDFESPSAEPGGFRVAFSLDLAQAQGSVAYGHNDVWILDLSKNVEDPTALTVVRKSESALRGLGVRWVAWNRDGITDDLAFSVDDPLDPVGGVLEWFGVDGGGGAPRESAFHPTSLHGPVMAAIEDVLGAGDLYLVALATGTGLFRFDIRSLSIHPYGEPPPPAVPDPPPAAIEEEAEFSPDGTKIAFIAGVLGDLRYAGGPLYVADLTRPGGVITGGSLRRVGTVARAVSPIWSPDGEWIVYHDNEVHDLFAIRATGGEDPIRLTHTGNMSAGNLTWLDPLPLPTTP